MTLARSLWGVGLLIAALASCQGAVVTGAGGATSTGTASGSTSSTTTSAGSTSSSTTSSSTTSSSGASGCVTKCLDDSDCQNTCLPQPGGAFCCDPSAQVCFQSPSSTCPSSSSSSSTSSGTGTGRGAGCDPGSPYVDVEGDGAPQHYDGSCAPAASLTIALGSTVWVLDTCTQGASDPLVVQFSSTVEWGDLPPWASVSAQIDYVKGGVHWSGTGLLSVPSFVCDDIANTAPPPGPYWFSGTFSATVSPPSADAGAPVTISGSFCVPATCSSSLPG